MSSADFAAAQARIQARRQQRDAQHRARLQAQQDARAASSISRLPYPFSRIGDAGLSVWDTIKGREGTRPAFRVGQVDAELLDEELLELLKGQVGEGLKYYGTHLTTDYGPEILLALRAVLFKLTIWDHNASYGAALQGLRYTNAHDLSPARPIPTRTQKGLYGILTVGGRYAWTRWEDYLLDQTTNVDYSAPLPPRRIQLLERLTNALSTTHSVAAFVSFLVFLTNGRYRTLLDRLLGLRLVPTSSTISREVSFEYLNRQLVWHAFTEFLLFLLPLVGVSRWRRILGRSWRKLKALVSGHSASSDDDSDGKTGGELGFLPERTCAICYSDQNPTAGAGSEEAILTASASAAGGGGVIGSAATDVTNPYMTVPCGCVYCFVCLAQRIEGEEGEGWMCLRCGEVATGCKPWDGDVLEEVGTRERSGEGEGKNVGFAAIAEEKEGEEGMGGDDEKSGLREVAPAPVDEVAGGTLTNENEVEGSLLGSRALSGSEEWARASRIMEEESEEVGSSSEDDQSEEIDEEEDEMEFDDEGI